jgi:hypothetical protein
LLIALEMRPIAKQISVMNRIAIVEYKIALWLNSYLDIELMTCFPYLRFLAIFSFVS